MKQTEVSLRSVATKAIALSLVVLMVPLTVSGYAQTTVTTPFRSGPPLGDSNSVITESKPSTPIQPVVSTSIARSDDNADKLLADIGSFQAQVSKTHLEYADPKNPTRDELVSLYSYLRAINPKEQDFIDRIEGLMASDGQNGSTMPSDRKEALQMYLKSLKEDMAASEKALSGIDSILNHQAEDSSRVASAPTSTPPPQPASTPNQGGFLGTHRGDVQDAGIVIGVGATAITLFEALKHLLSN